MLRAVAAFTPHRCEQSDRKRKRSIQSNPCLPTLGLILSPHAAMKVTILIAMSAICILNTGCTLSDNLLRTSLVQPILYSSYWDLKLERHRFRRLAEVELERARTIARAESDSYSCPPFSLDHERGFKAGFIDYLTYGGTGTPPPMPPRRYWWSGCDGPLEYGAIQDWYKGFQHGAAVAEATGYRNCVTIPLSDSLLINTLPYYPGQFSEGEYGETIETPLGELDGPGDADAVAAGPARDRFSGRRDPVAGPR